MSGDVCPGGFSGPRRDAYTPARDRTHLDTGYGHDELIATVLRYDVDIMAINETWLREGEIDRAPVIPGYKLRHTPRPPGKRMRGGGVGMYVKTGLKVGGKSIMDTWEVKTPGSAGLLPAKNPLPIFGRCLDYQTKPDLRIFGRCLDCQTKPDLRIFGRCLDYQTKPDLRSFGRCLDYQTKPDLGIFGRCLDCQTKPDLRIFGRCLDYQTKPDLRSFGRCLDYQTKPDLGIFGRCLDYQTKPDLRSFGRCLDYQTKPDLGIFGRCLDYQTKPDLRSHHMTCRGSRSYPQERPACARRGGAPHRRLRRIQGARGDPPINSRRTAARAPFTTSCSDE
ncbi:unnamed protein product [Plutella xylostella]|uniref:(diamondback moth) hypothetical protein n=1 Tax=Plutella xylostella TaxID=51655 RepID=A0A8S4G3S3_PLUXY|nr:unnamed protein product [Plutella xylostella]